MIRLVGVTAAVLLLLGATAAAANPPKITSGPTIEGTPQVGAELQAHGEWAGGPPPQPSWKWLRCPRQGACSAIAGATSDRYRVVAADAGSTLRVDLVVTNKGGSDEAQSAPTAVVTAAPGASPTPTPTPSPTPTPRPIPAPAPTATPTFDVPNPVVAPPAAPASSAAPRRIKPFPVIRIKGVLTLRGARITLLSVRAPRGVRVTVVCRGRDCPVHRYRTAKHRLRRFERSLRAGTRLQISVTKTGYIGKRTVIVIRHRKAPSRSDRCLNPSGRVLSCAGL
jgi:hypothetical protein